MSFKTLMSSLLDCFVHKNGGGVVGNVYGIRATALSLSSMTGAVTGAFDETTGYSVPFDAIVVVESIANSDSAAIRITVNDTTVLRTNVVTTETFSLFVPKGSVIKKSGGASLNSIVAYPLAQ